MERTFSLTLDVTVSATDSDREATAILQAMTVAQIASRFQSVLNGGIGHPNETSVVRDAHERIQQKR